MKSLMGQFAKLQGVETYLDRMDHEQVKLGGFTNAEMTPHNFAPSVKLPVLTMQVRDDKWTTNQDGEKTSELVGSADKEMLWGDGPNRRFCGYN